MQGQDQDQADAITASLAKDGQTTPTANLPMGNFKHTGVGKGTVRTSGSAQYADVESVQDGTYTYAAAGGSGGAYTLTLSPAIPAYVAGQTFWFKANHTNTGAATLAVSGLSALALQSNGKALVAGQIISGGVYEATHDGTQFQVRGLAGAQLWDSNQSHKAQLINGQNLTADRTWTFTFPDADTTFTYETGTFTPGLTFGGNAVGMAGTFQGRYTRIGNRCLFDIRVTLSAKGSSTGNALVTGLPFTTTANNSNFPMACKVDLVNLDVGGGYYQVAPIFNQSATTIVMVEIGDNVSNANLTDADFSDTSSIRLSGHFEI